MSSRNLLLATVGIAMLAVLWQVYPDLARYLKISRM